MFKVGDRVTLKVNDKFYDCEDPSKPGIDPIYGEIYTIDGFNGDYISFKEIPDIAWDGKRYFYHSSCFRKVITQSVSKELAEKFEDVESIPIKEKELV